MCQELLWPCILRFLERDTHILGRKRSSLSERKESLRKGLVSGVLSIVPADPPFAASLTAVRLASLTQLPVMRRSFEYSFRQPCEKLLL